MTLSEIIVDSLHFWFPPLVMTLCSCDSVLHIIPAAVWLDILIGSISSLKNWNVYLHSFMITVINELLESCIWLSFLWTFCTESVYNIFCMLSETANRVEVWSFLVVVMYISKHFRKLGTVLSSQNFLLLVWCYETWQYLDRLQLEEELKDTFCN